MHKTRARKDPESQIRMAAQLLQQIATCIGQVFLGRQGEPLARLGSDGANRSAVWERIQVGTACTLHVGRRLCRQRRREQQTQRRSSTCIATVGGGSHRGGRPARPAAGGMKLWRHTSRTELALRWTGAIPSTDAARVLRLGWVPRRPQAQNRYSTLKIVRQHRNLPDSGTNHAWTEPRDELRV
jgi:hypothetical protein